MYGQCKYNVSYDDCLLVYKEVIGRDDHAVADALEVMAYVMGQ